MRERDIFDETEAAGALALGCREEHARQVWLPMNVRLRIRAHLATNTIKPPFTGASVLMAAGTLWNPDGVSDLMNGGARP